MTQQQLREIINRISSYLNETDNRTNKVVIIVENNEIRLKSKVFFDNCFKNILEICIDNQAVFFCQAKNDIIEILIY